MRKIFLGAVAAAVVSALAVTAFIYSGLYNIAADSPHARLTEKLLNAVREHSVAARAAEIVVPDLQGAALVESGAEHYKAMCTGCHLAPGVPDTELRDGLYPTPPNLSEQGMLDPARSFWVIKHGVKLTGMPAWGETHDDESIWGLVAFIRKLPELTPEEYESMTAGAGDSHGHDHSEHGNANSTRTGKGQDGHMHEHKAGQTSTHLTDDHSHRIPGSAVGVLDAFHHALEEGRGDEALQYLADDVIVLEGGHAQTLAEYASGHLANDMAFLAAMDSTRLSREVRSSDSGDQMTVVTRNRLRGTYGDKALDLVSSETAVLEKREGQWKIVHVHWSS